MKPTNEEFMSVFGQDSGLSGCDFRPTFDGWLYNAHSVISKLPTRDEQIDVIWRRAKEISEWIVERRSRYEEGDRFQIIIGWPLSIRTSSRQIVKTGGGFDVVASLFSAQAIAEYEASTGQIFLRDRWDYGIFGNSS
jgi:hypothetical protein